jgi:hypothetical protein
MLVGFGLGAVWAFGACCMFYHAVTKPFSSSVQAMSSSSLNSHLP